VRDFVSSLRRLRIACDLVERDAIYYATTQGAAARLRAELDRRLLAGFEGEWLGTRESRAVAGISSPGAIRTRGNAQFDPYKACTGLAAVAASLGAKIFERSAVTRINQRRGRVCLHTSTGHVDAAGVVVATGYATPHFRPLAGRFRLYRTYVLATEPLRRPLRRQIGVADVMLWDTRRPYHYLRWGPGRRLLLGGGDRAIRRGQRRDLRFASATRGLREYFQAMFPALADVRTERAWEGVFATTPDGLPYVGPHRRYPRHLFALGYGGNGMTLGFLASRMLLEQWQKIASPDHELFRFGR
jgi:glycine/D-amino acid oxidase-like deaminating enzyme